MFRMVETDEDGFEVPVVPMGGVPVRECCNPEDLWGCTVADRCCLVEHEPSSNLERLEQLLAKPRLTAVEWAWVARQLENPLMQQQMLQSREPENVTDFPDDDANVIKVPFHRVLTAEELDDLADYFVHTFELSSH